MSSKLYGLMSLLGVLAVFSCTEARADYNYSFGNSRVIQGGNGLSTPSGSYIGGGTLSPSARGYSQTGAQVNPGLPSVPMGSHVGTPGDNQYGAHPINTNPGSRQPSVGTAQPNNGMNLPGTPLGAHIGTAGDGIRSDLNPNAYNSNQKFSWPVSRARQQTAEQQPILIIPQGGPATYGETSTSGVHF